MAYQRFLTDKDYQAVISPEHFEMLVRDMPDRVIQAEHNAEMNFLEYLDQYYEIEKVFRAGKAIREYNPGVSYPPNVWFKKDGVIYKTMMAVRGYKKPTSQQYWEQLTELWAIPDADRKPKYSQLHTYAIGDIVRFGTEWYVCKIANGYNFDNIHLPGITAWRTIETTPWQPNLEWETYSVCSYKGNFYMKLAPVDIVNEALDTPDANPEVNDLWAMIGDYRVDYEYSADESAHDYVVCEGMVFAPNANPNAEEIKDGVNIMPDDPRNQNVIQHMVRIATYYLHQLISPTNISETRRWAYEDSMRWLIDASKFHINPRLPRKKDKEDGGDKVDWALETYQREFDPNNDMWLI